MQLGHRVYVSHHTISSLGLRPNSLMSLLDRLRGQPEWQHDDPSVRASAVDDLADDAQDLLEAIAIEDTDPGVRLVAVARLSDPTAIRRVAENDPDDRVRSEATLILREFAVDAADVDLAGAALAGLSAERDLTEVARTARFEAVSRMALGQLESPKALGAVARRSSHGAVRDAALARLDDRDEIVAVAVKSDHRDIALAAFDRLAPAWPEDEERLKMIAVRARTKPVSRRAKSVLTAFAAQPVPPTPGELDRQRQELCERLEGLVQTREWDVVSEGLGKAEREWRALGDLQVSLVPSVSGSRDDSQPGGGLPETATDERWTRALALVREQLDRARGEADRRRHARKVAVEVRAALCERVAELVADESEDAVVRMAEIVKVQAEWEAVVEVPLVAGESDTGAESELRRRFEELVSSAKQQAERQHTASERLEKLGELVKTLETLSGSSETEDLTVRWKRPHAEWAELVRTSSAIEVADFVARVEVAQTKRDERLVAAREERRRREQANLAKQQARCDEIERAVADENLELQEAERRVRLTRSLLGNLGRLPTREDRVSLMTRLQAAQSALNGRVRELRGLVEWKQWANIGVQAALCQRLEALATVDDDVALTKQFKAVVSEWRQASDVPQGEGEALWQRFKTAHDVVYQRVEAQLAREDVLRQGCLGQKVALCEEAERLAESTDWIKTAQRMTELQEQWKGIGSAPRKQEREVWGRFRAAGGRFFRRRRDDLVERKQIWAKNAQLKEELCEKAEVLSGETDLAAAKETVRRLQAKWKQVGPVRRTRSEALWRRFRAACDQVYTREQEAVNAKFTEQIAARVSLCERIEVLAAGADDSAVEPSKEVVAGATDTAATAPEDVVGSADTAATAPEDVVGSADTAATAPEDVVGTTETAAEPPEDLAEMVMTVRAEWRQAQPIPHSQERSITARFETAITRVVERYPAAFSGTDLDPERHLAELERLCEQVEALLEDQTPPQVNDESPAEILARQLREALASNTMGGRVDPEVKRQADADTVKRLQAERRAFGPVPGEAGHQLSERFRTACDRFFQQYPAQATERARPRNRRNRPSGHSGTRENS